MKVTSGGLPTPYCRMVRDASFPIRLAILLIIAPLLNYKLSHLQPFGVKPQLHWCASLKLPPPTDQRRRTVGCECNWLIGSAQRIPDTAMKMRHSRFALYCHGRVEDSHRIGGLFGREAAMSMRLVKRFLGSTILFLDVLPALFYGYYYFLSGLD